MSIKGDGAGPGWTRAALFCALILGACASFRPAPGEVTVAIEAAPSNIDPRYATDANSALIDDLVFPGLLRSDGTGGYLPDLAESWRQPDATTYVFRLRPDCRFHDGRPVTAADVVATYTAVRDPALHSPKASTLGPLASVEARDPATVVFHLRKPFAPFLESAAIGILPETAARSPAPPTVGAGPFRLAAVVPDERIVLEAFPAYRPRPPRLRRVIFRIIPDGMVRVLQLVRGGIDLVQNGIEPDVLPWLRAHTRLRIELVPSTTFNYLGFNLRDPRLADRRVRQAIAYAIDRDSIITHILKGLAVPATGLLSPGHWAYEPAVRRYPHDPARARRLLDAAGYPDPDGPGPLPRFRLSYKTSTVELRRRIAEALQRQLAEVGIALDIRTYEWATFYSDIRHGNFHLYSLAWVGVNDPDLYYSIFNSSMVPPHGDNRGGFASPRMDLLTAAARHTASRPARRHLYRAVQRLAAKDLPYVPLWWPLNAAVSRPRLHGFRPSPTGDLRSLTTAWTDNRSGRRSRVQ